MFERMVSSHLSISFFSGDTFLFCINTLLNTILSLTYRWLKMVWWYWLHVDYNYNIMSVHTVYYLLFKWCLRPTAPFHGINIIRIGISISRTLQIQIQIFYWHKHNYNNWQRPKVKLQFMFMNRKHNNMTHNIIMYKIQDYNFLYNNAVRPVIYVRRLAFYWYVENTSISASFYKDETNVTSPLSFIKVPVPSQESELSCICHGMLGLSNCPLSTSFLLDFGTVPTVMVFFLIWRC